MPHNHLVPYKYESAYLLCLHPLLSKFRAQSYCYGIALLFLLFRKKMAVMWRTLDRWEVSVEIRGWEEVLIISLWVFVLLLLGPMRVNCVLVILPSCLLHFSFLDSWPKARLTCVTNIISTQDVSHLIPFRQPLLFSLCYISLLLHLSPSARDGIFPCDCGSLTSFCFSEWMILFATSREWFTSPEDPSPRV